jgi:hypothetical protein
MSSLLKNMDWYEELEEYTPDNRIVELLEEDNDDISGTLNYLTGYSESIDTDTFSIWCDNG